VVIGAGEFGVGDKASCCSLGEELLAIEEFCLPMPGLIIDAGEEIETGGSEELPRGY